MGCDHASELAVRKGIEQGFDLEDAHLAPRADLARQVTFELEPAALEVQQDDVVHDRAAVLVLGAFLARERDFFAPEHHAVELEEEVGFEREVVVALEPQRVGGSIGRRQVDRLSAPRPQPDARHPAGAARARRQGLRALRAGPP
jgi:hypothetical protein